MLGSIIGGALGAGASAYSTWQGAKNLDKSLAAQKEENETTREYNRQLAAQQNEWNIQQWNRENAALKQATADERAYNSPAAQKARLEAAGLNSDMIYGQGGISNTSSAAGVASSPEMTAGAAGTSVDWSSLANRPTVGDAIMRSLTIDQARANVKKTEAEAKSAGVEADIAEKYGLDGAALRNDSLRETINKLANESRGIDLDNTLKQLENDFVNKFNGKIMQNYLQRLETSTGMSANALKQDIETLALRIAGVNSENSKLERLSNFSKDEWGIALEMIKLLLGR